MRYEILPGRPSPRGATWDGSGVNFSLFSADATRVDLCLFEPDDPAVEVSRLVLPESTAHVWHGYVPGLQPGQPYGYRVHGPFRPREGLRFNPHKVLLDPYARAVTGGVDWKAGHPYSYGFFHPEKDLSFDEQDSAAAVPKGLVIDPHFDWQDDSAPRTPWNRTIIYETHVKGLTMRHPDVPEELRGTYSALTTEPILKYFKKLGVTAVELLPIHFFVDDNYLIEKNLTNYWGYSTLGYFALEPRYSRRRPGSDQVREFKEIVRALHGAGIEVILDVVYNHTAEGNQLGPTLSYKGIDNRSYYRLVAGDKRYYMDFTGTGNTLNSQSPEVLKLIMDSLRYWVCEMHVDGFRFDLASTLAREEADVDRMGSFFDVIHQDPILSEVKLIAEPWDVGPGGYQVGNFPNLWAEWNGKYRDTIRSYWKGEEGVMGELGFRLTGSSDLYGSDGRRPNASINFITAHDGFTLNDLVSYNEKHNEANGEQNQDGHSHNISWNHGEEGPTENSEIVEIRERQKRNFLATLLLSQGVPMLLGGDELGRSQGGNNNAYCQDNEISWYDWELDERQESLLEFTRRLIEIRSAHPVLRRKNFFQGRPIRGSEIHDITWFTPDGRQMTEEEWSADWNRTLGMRLGGEALGESDSEGNPVEDDNFLLLFNAHHEPVEFILPERGAGAGWKPVIDTSRPGNRLDDEWIPGGECYTPPGRSMVLLQEVERRTEKRQKKEG
jgi:isoamylase